MTIMASVSKVPPGNSEKYCSHFFCSTTQEMQPDHFILKSHKTHILLNKYMNCTSQQDDPSSCTIIVLSSFHTSSLSPLTCTQTLPLAPPPTYLASFNAFCQHDNILDSVLPNHPPECGKSVLSRPWEGELLW